MGNVQYELMKNVQHTIMNVQCAIYGIGKRAIYKEVCGLICAAMR